MSEKFQRLEPARKNQLVNAALKEFAAKGYDEASTNIIAKEAGFSKSLLFHYVGSKQELFLLVYDITLQTIMDDFFGLIDLTQPDMLERCRQIAFVKMDVLHKYPQLFDFFKVAIDTGSEEVKAELEARNKGLRSVGFDKLFGGVDKSLFRPDIDPDKAVQLMVWFLNGLADDMQRQVADLRMDEIDYDGLTEQANAFFEIMRTCFYRDCLLS